MEIFNKELQALEAILKEAIIKSSEEDGIDPVFHEVDVSGVNPFADKETLLNVYEHLSRKGLILCSGMEDDNGNEILEFVCITPNGLDALKLTKGVH